MGWSDRLGSLERGYFADVLAVDGDPLADITALQKPHLVMKGGQIVH
jgi:imidazolonepropionase-like amidohydrolase